MLWSRDLVMSRPVTEETDEEEEEDDWEEGAEGLLKDIRK